VELPTPRGVVVSLLDDGKVNILGFEMFLDSNNNLKKTSEDSGLDLSGHNPIISNKYYVD